MERIEFEYVAYVWDRSRDRYVQLGYTLSGNYEDCLQVFNEHREKWQSELSDFDYSDYHIKFRKIVYTAWEVIYE